MVKAKTIIKIYFWEFLQNLPALAALLWGAQWWPRLWGLLIAFAGGLGSALIIALTEHYKDPGYREPIRMVVANAIGFSFMVIVASALLSWVAGWIPALLLGLVFGAAVACIQNLVQTKSISVRHVLAIGLGSAAALALIVVVDQLGMGLPLKVLIVNGLVTAIIVVVDYVIGLSKPNAGGSM
jgi:hypothetical protein